MALNLSKEQRDELMRSLKKAVPYDDDAEEINTFDYAGKVDTDRWLATMAKKLLEQDDREKAQNGQ